MPDSIRKTPFKLNEDILYLIALNFERDRRTLCAFTRVSHAFHHATQLLLYRHIDGLSDQKKKLLEQKFENDPSLRNYVLSCSIELDRGVPQHDGLEHALTYPNLKETSIKSLDKTNQVEENADYWSHWTLMTRISRLRLGRTISQDFQCAFLNKHSFPRIPTVHLSGDLTTTEIMRFMLLPNIRSVHAKDLGILRTATLPERFASQKSNLTSLTLTGNVLWSIDNETMRSVVELCPLLRSLCCQVPVMTTLNNRVALSSSVNNTVRPRDLTAVFEPIRETLQHLSLLQLRHDVPYDRSYMDFTRFTALKDLEITSCCLIGDGPPGNARYRLGDLLPASLQHLKLDFPRESGIFYLHGESQTFRSQNPVAIPITQWSWISHFLETASEELPDLKSVTMRESPGGVGYWRWKEVNWTPPLPLKTLARQLGVRLDIRISYPYPKSEADSWIASEISSGHRRFPWE